MHLLPKKFIIVISLFLFIFPLLHPRKTEAAQNNPNTTGSVWDFNVQKTLDREDKDRQKEAKEGVVSVDAYKTTKYNLGSALMGTTEYIMPLSSEQAMDPNRPTAIGALTQAIGYLYQNPPASAQAYTYDLLTNAGFLAKTAQAQGIGFAGLSPLLPLWKTARNISYSILIIVMVAIGFMIIFRMKIDPKTVISIQAAIPKIIMTLLIITFSYPIAGFLIDLMYLVIFLIIQILGNAVPADQLAAGAGFIKDIPTQQAEFTQSGLQGWVKLIVSVFSFGMIPAFFQQMFLSGPGGLAQFGIIILVIILAISNPLLWLVPVILILIIGCGLLFTLIRLTMILFNSYIQILLAVIFGPILLLKEAIPGQSAFGEWIMNIMANLVVFPATIGVIYLSWIMTTIMWNGKLWGAPLTPFGGGGGDYTLPIVGTVNNGNPMAIFLGLGIIFLAPTLVVSVKKAFHPKPTLPITGGTAFAPATGALSTGMGAMQSMYYFNTTLGEHGPLKGVWDKLGIGKGK